MSAPRRLQRTALASVVLAAHVAVLTPLGLRIVQTSTTAEPRVIDIVLRRPPPQASPPREPLALPSTGFGGSVRSTRPAQAEGPAALPGATTETVDTVTAPTATGAAIARAMRLNGDCRRLIDPAERDLCMERRNARLAGSDQLIRPIEDAAFAAEGQRALADYDRRRAPLKPNSRAVPCPNSDPMGRCDFRVETRIWSSRDGLLPDVPRRD